MRKEGMENLTTTGKIAGKRNRGQQRITFVKSLYHLLNITTFQLLQSVKDRVLQRLQTNIFLMRTQKTLGNLVALRFVTKVSVADLQSKKIYYFLCNSWVGHKGFKGETILKTFHVASKITTLNIKYLFTSFIDNHTIFSMFCSPATSRFTRFERVGVCMNLLLGYLMCNLLFLKSISDGEDGDDDDDGPKSIGRLMFSMERIKSAFYCTLVMFPVTTGIESMFQFVIRPKMKIGIILDWMKRREILQKDLLGITVVENIKKFMRSKVFKAMRKKKKQSAQNLLNMQAVTTGGGRGTRKVLEHYDSDYFIKEYEFEDGIIRDTRELINLKRISDLSRRMNLSKNAVNAVKYMDAANHKSSNVIKSSLASIFKNKAPTIRFQPIHMLSGKMDVYNDGMNWRTFFSENTAIGRNEYSLSEYRSEKFDNGFLPRYFIVVAWGITISCMIAFSITVLEKTNGIEKYVMIHWFAGCFMSFFIGMVIDDPLKIIIASFIFSIVIRKVREHGFRNANLTKYMCLRGLEKTNAEQDRVTLNEMQNAPEYKVPNRSLNMLLIEAENIRSESVIIMLNFIIFMIIVSVNVCITAILHKYEYFLQDETYYKKLFYQPAFRKIQRKEDLKEWMKTYVMKEFYSGSNESLLEEDELFRYTSTPGLFLACSPRFRRTTTEGNAWAYFLAGVLATRNDGIDLGIYEEYALEKIDEVFDGDYFNTTFYFNELEIILYSMYSDLTVLVDIRSFLMPGGGILVDGEVRPLADRLEKMINPIGHHENIVDKVSSVYLNSSGREWTNLFLIIYMLFIVVLCGVTVHNIVYLGVAEFFSSFWHFLDLIGTVFGLFVIPSAVFIMIDTSSNTEDFMENGYVDVVEIAFSRLIYLYFQFIDESVSVIFVILLMFFPIFLGAVIFLYMFYGKYMVFLYTIEYTMVSAVVGFTRGYRYNNMNSLFGLCGHIPHAAVIVAYTLIVQYMCAAVVYYKVKVRTMMIFVSKNDFVVERLSNVSLKIKNNYVNDCTSLETNPQVRTARQALLFGIASWVQKIFEKSEKKCHCSQAEINKEV
ncbi:hypothetical protein HELRODRAFT_165229 [Helobdella robusta]|uniref:Uncharacterized protein n=1 Tax=Helobdella robusta TaxID=6412 RepID=T1EWG8_HELRO|nr:hypothetical protein HELRODRAFT_165229 [Helobdella robusta]ESN93070.1 hypothetical protein HELRODRAFT_165229 [Helobdella robusta]